MHRALLAAPPVVLLLLVGFLTVGGGSQAQYFTAKVEKGEIAQVVQATGTINALTTVQVGSQVSGTIEHLYADFNSQVKKGQVVAQIEPSILRTRLLQAEADLQNSQANVKSLQAQIENQKADTLAATANVARAKAQFREAELNMQRTSELFQQGIFSAAQKDTAEANYEGAKADVAVAEAQLEQSKARMKTTEAQLEQARAQVAQRRAAYEMAKVDLSHAVITAPIDGTVIARNVDVGQTVAASFQAPTLFIIAQDLTKMQVYAKTDEADVGKIKVGSVARFRVDSFPRDTFFGRVTQVRMNATMVQNVVTYDTIIEFDNPEKKLFPGMTAYVTIVIDRVGDVVKIPNGALRFRPEMTQDEINELYDKYKIPEVARQRTETSGGLAKAGGARPSGAGGQSGGSGGGSAGPSSPGGGEGGGMARGAAVGEGGGEGAPRMMGGGMRGPRDEWKIVWKLGPDKRLLVPVAVKVGLTDSTFTQLKEGDLKENDELVIGQSTGKASTSAQQSLPGSRPGGPMGGLGMRPH
jgi:HlyD family secretion protein